VEVPPLAIVTLVAARLPLAAVVEKVAVFPLSVVGNVAVTVMVVASAAVRELTFISTGVATMFAMVALRVLMVLLRVTIVASRVAIVLLAVFNCDCSDAAAVFSVVIWPVSVVTWALAAASWLDSVLLLLWLVASCVVRLAT